MGLFSTDDSSDDSDEDTTDSAMTGGFKKVDEFGGVHLERTIDREAGVVLYSQQLGGARKDYGGKGLAAVPIKDTDLTIDDGGNE
jgi:hypothetical protein